MVDTTQAKCQCECKNQKIGWDDPFIRMTGLVPDTLVSPVLGIKPETFRDWCVDRLVVFVEIRGVMWMRCEEIKKLILTGQGSRKPEAS